MNKRQLELSTVIASPPEYEPIVEFTSLGALGQRVLAFSATDVAAALSRATNELTRICGQ